MSQNKVTSLKEVNERLAALPEFSRTVYAYLVLSIAQINALARAAEINQNKYYSEGHKGKRSASFTVCLEGLEIKEVNGQQQIATRTFDHAVAKINA